MTPTPIPSLVKTRLKSRSKMEQGSFVQWVNSPGLKGTFVFPLTLEQIILERAMTTHLTFFENIFSKSTINFVMSEIFMVCQGPLHVFTL